MIILIPADAITRFRETRQELLSGFFQDFFQKEVAQKVTKTTKAGFQGSEIISKARRNRRIAIKECRMSKGRAEEPSTDYGFHRLEIVVIGDICGWVFFFSREDRKARRGRGDDRIIGGRTICGMILAKNDSDLLEVLERAAEESITAYAAFTDWKSV
jgi:hypothetical protein